MESPGWMKKKKSKNEPQICLNDNKCFQYASKILLNFDEIKKHPQKVSNVQVTNMATTVLYTKKWKYVQLMFQKFTRFMKNRWFY